jgi:hypothetical protein
MTISPSYLESPLLDELYSFGDKSFPENRSKRVFIAFFYLTICFKINSTDKLYVGKIYGGEGGSEAVGEEECFNLTEIAAEGNILH